MNMNKCAKRFALGIALSGASMGAMAFSDGTLSQTSTGTFDVRLLLGMEARVWGLQDISFTSATGKEKKNGNFCVYSASDRVSIKMQSKFQLKDTAGATMDYIVRLKGVGADTGVIPSQGGNVGNPNTMVTWGNPAVSPDNLDGATHSLFFAAQSKDSTSCNATTENLNVEVEFTAPSSAFTTPGTVTDKVELVVEPA